MSSLRRALPLALATLSLCAPVGAAEPDWPAPPEVANDERVSLSVSNRAGLVEAPFFTTAFPQVSGFASVLTGSAAVRLSSFGSLRLRLPVSFVRLDYPARAQVAATAFGNAELGFERLLRVRPSTKVGFVGAFLIPTAAHGPEASLLDNRALALGNALDAGKESALMTPGVTGLRLAASVRHAHPPFEFGARLDVPLLIRLSDSSLPADADTHSIGLLPALDLRAALTITSWFSASLALGLVTEPLRVAEPVRARDRARRLQPLVEPAVLFRVGRHVTLGLDGSIPIGGTLGGDAWGVGTLVRLGF